MIDALAVPAEDATWNLFQRGKITESAVRDELRRLDFSPTEADQWISVAREQINGQKPKPRRGRSYAGP